MWLNAELNCSIEDLLTSEIKKIIDTLKQDLRVLILGAYYPPNAKKRLEGLRECLKKRGILNTFLVADFPDSTPLDKDVNIHWELKSNQLMLNFDLNLFVFFANCNNEGVTDELSYFCNNSTDFFRCYIMCEESHRMNISSRIKAKVKKHILYNDKFEDGYDAELCDAVYAFIEMMLMRYRDRLFKLHI